MVPRPRNTANKNLPQNLYFNARRSTYQPNYHQAAMARSRIT